jgi:hypothetical protein
MATVRGFSVEKRDRGWTWVVGGVKWSLEMLPERTLRRRGVDLTPMGRNILVTCVDDALLFSFGFEACLNPEVRKAVGMEGGGG